MSGCWSDFGSSAREAYKVTYESQCIVITYGDEGTRARTTDLMRVVFRGCIADSERRKK